MTLFVLAQLLYISLHVEKNAKGTKIREKNPENWVSGFSIFKFVTFLVLEKTFRKNQKLPGHFWKPKKFQEGDCFELAGFFPSSRCAWWCTCQSINKSLGIQRNLQNMFFAIQRGSIGELLEFALRLRLFRFSLSISKRSAPIQLTARQPQLRTHVLKSHFFSQKGCKHVFFLRFAMFNPFGFSYLNGILSGIILEPTFLVPRSVNNFLHVQPFEEMT